MNIRWMDDLFVKHGELYAKVLTSMMPQAQAECRWIADCFSERGITAGNHVLDLCCGVGRHSIELAKLGYRVTGVDLSPVHMERASAMAEDHGVSELVTFHAGDMRELKKIVPDETFGAVINLFTSFGFFDDETDIDILRQCRTLAGDDGVFLLDTMNRDWLVQHFQPQGFSRFEKFLFLEERKLDQGTSWMHSTWTILEEKSDGQFEPYSEIFLNHRLYKLSGLIRQFSQAGWTFRDVFGSLSGDEFGLGTKRIVALFASNSH